MLMLMALRFGIPGHNAVIQGQQIQMKQKAIAAHAPGLFQCAVGLVGFETPAQPPPGGWPASLQAILLHPPPPSASGWRRTLGDLSASVS